MKIFSLGVLWKWALPALLAIGFAVCLALSLKTSKEIAASGKRTLLIAHWQGERGCKESLQSIIDEYEKLHPNVEVRQQIMIGMGSSYLRWCLTQLMACSPPDIMEYHPGFRPYLPNYFAGLSLYVAKPNPYNAGTDLEGVPWKDCFYGGMRGAWEPQLMDYYSVPNTLYTMRFYCDKSMLKDATDSAGKPETVKEFLELCAKLKERGITPIVAENGRGEAGQQFFSNLYSQMFWILEDSIDYNHDGRVDGSEYYRGFLSGDFKFDTPRMRALLKLMEKFSSNWGKGADAMNIEVAPYLFIQGRGSCYFSGSWLGRQMTQSCKFQLGDFPFPLIGKDDPVAGQYYCGPWGENMLQPGMSLAVAEGPNKELAIDFLRFLTTRANNAKFNAGPCWLPAVLGASAPAEMKGFEPLIRGKSLGMGFLTQSTLPEFRRDLQGFTSGAYGADELLSKMAESYGKHAPADYEKSSIQSLRLLSRLEEIRDGIDMDRFNAAKSGGHVSDGEIMKLEELYESQVIGLNAIHAVKGASHEKR